MKPRPTSLLLLLAAAFALWPALARADVRPFSAGALIIPMDSCYQPAVDTIIPSGCQNGGLTPGDGIVKAYGLVYLLLRRGITVYVITDPNKASISAVDLTLTQAGGSSPPAGLYDRATQTARSFTSASSISYRGSPFLIDAGDADSVKELLATDSLLSAFTSVAVHVSYVSFSAPINLRMNGVPPRVAVYTPTAGGGTAGTEGIPLMQAYLLRAGLNYSGASGTPAAPGDIYDLITNSDILAGRLTPSAYEVLWLPHFDNTSAGTDVLDVFASYADQGGIIIGQCASIFMLESYAPTRFLSQSTAISWNKTTTGSGAMDCYPGNPAGWNRSGNPAAYAGGLCFNPMTPVAPVSGAALAFPSPAHVLVQIGDFRHYAHWGTIVDFAPAATRAGATVLMKTQDTRSSRNNALLMSLIRKDNDPNKGQIIYFGGHFYGDATTPMTAGMRIVLNTLLFTKPTYNEAVLTRASAIRYTVGGKALLLQGVYEENSATTSGVYRSAADASSFVFPQTPGHVLAFDTARLFTGFQRLSGNAALVFDTAKLIVGAATRALYTSKGTGSQAALVALNAAGLAQAGSSPLGFPSGSADEATLLGLIRGAKLGGIDHSTIAVVGQQALVPGGATRPTVAYAGGLDGMLHAVALSGSSMVQGSELWALLPREILPGVRDNSAGLDGSPCIGDTYDLVNGARQFRTLLIIPQGRYGQNVYGLDVSQPLTPQLLWARGSPESGVTLGNADGAAQVIVSTANNRTQGLVVLASNRPSGSAGLLVSGLASEDGRVLWQFSTAHQRLLPGTPAPVPNDMPPVAIAGPTATGSGYERVYAADLDGRVWELNSGTGVNVNGAAALADVGLTSRGNTQPIGAPPVLAVDRTTGKLLLLVVTGGMDWAVSNDTYALYAFDLTAAGRQTATSTRGVASLLYRVPLPTGQRGFAPPAVSGNDVYVLGSTGVLSGRISQSASDTGTLLRVSLASGQITATANLTKGAGAFTLAADGASILGTTARDVWQLRPTGADSRGTAIGAGRGGLLLRRLWLESR